MGREWRRIQDHAGYAVAHGLGLSDMCAALGVNYDQVRKWAEQGERGDGDPEARVVLPALQRAMAGCGGCMVASRPCDQCRTRLKKTIEDWKANATAMPQAPAVDPDAKCQICFARRCRRHGV